MDLTTLQARCRTRFRDADQDVVTNEEWTGYLNDAYRDVLGAEPYWPFLDSSTPADLSAGSDTPTFDSRWHNILVEGALNRAYLDDGNAEQAALHAAEFGRQLAEMKDALLRGRRRSR